MLAEEEVEDIIMNPQGVDVEDMEKLVQKTSQGTLSLVTSSRTKPKNGVPNLHIQSKSLYKKPLHIPPTKSDLISILTSTVLRIGVPNLHIQSKLVYNKLIFSELNLKYGHMMF